MGRTTKTNKKAVTDEKPREVITGEVAQQFWDTIENDTIAWGHMLLPEHFRLKPIPRIHDEITTLARIHPRLALAAPRGIAKSTVISFLKPLKHICLKEKRFIVIVSNTFSQSSLILKTIKMELKENRMIRERYGITLTKDAEGETVFRHPDGFETMVLCKGAEQAGTIRGVKFGAYRPDLILLDDVENDELCRSPERRQKLKEDFDNAITPAGDVGTQIVVVGTIMHDDSLLATLLREDDYSEYHKKKYVALLKRKSTGDLLSVWPGKYPVDDLLRMRKDKPAMFAKEFQNDPSSGDQAAIKKEDFRRWRFENNECLLFDSEGNVAFRYDITDCVPAVAFDLAWEEKRDSDYSVIMPGYLTPGSDILIDNYTCKKGMRPHEIYEIVFSLDAKMKALTGQRVMFGFEKAKLEKVIRHLLKGEMRRRNQPLSFRDLLWDGDKLQRIMTRLEPRYNQHMIYHKSGMGDLETQLTRLRSSAHDDLADCAQGLVQLLQYPRKVTPKDKQINQFNLVRQLAIDARNPKKKTLSQMRFGVKRRPRINAIKSPW